MALISQKLWHSSSCILSHTVYYDPNVSTLVKSSQRTPLCPAQYPCPPTCSHIDCDPRFHSLGSPLFATAASWPAEILRLSVCISKHDGGTHSQPGEPTLLGPLFLKVVVFVLIELTRGSVAVLEVQCNVLVRLL